MYHVEWVGPLVLSASEVARVPLGVPGVYLLHILALSRGGYPVAYAGQAINLHRRLKEHLCGSTAVQAIRRMGFSPYFSAAPVPRLLLAPAESALIRLLRPPCNANVPSAPPLLITLPPLTLF
jgi:hypothetical protein